MKIFQAIGNADIVKAFYDKAKIKLDYLISYPYLEGQTYKLTKEYRSMINSLYLDSGAFSVSTGRSEITVSEYSAYINRYGHFFDEVFNLDDDFENPDHNLENFLYLSQTLSPNRKRIIPVVHDIKDPFGELESYVELGCDYIAVGSNKKLKDDVFKKIRDKYPDLKLHMFGTLNRKMLTDHRPYSADSASFARAAAMGTIFYWHPDEKKEYQIYVGERDKSDAKIPHFKNFKYKRELEEFLAKTFQYKYRDLLGSTDAKWIVNFYFFKQLENYINSLP